MWSWDNLITGLTLKSHLKTTIIPAKRGSIIDKNNTILLQITQVHGVDYTELVDTLQENSCFQLLQAVFQNRIPAFQIHNRYVENNILADSIPIGVVMSPLLLQPECTSKYFRYI